MIECGVLVVLYFALKGQFPSDFKQLCRIFREREREREREKRKGERRRDREKQSERSREREGVL